MPDPPQQLPDPTQPSFLKRWLGWRSLALSVVVLILLSPVAYRGWRLGLVPQADDPFDVKKLAGKHIPEDENAAVLMREAVQKLVDVPVADQDAYYDEQRDGWDPGDTTLDRYLTANQSAIELWRTAADRSSFQMDLDSIDVEQQLNITQDLRQLNRFALYQLEKETATGNPQAAIPWIEAMIRNAYLVRHQFEFDLIGIAQFAIGAKATNEWSTHPGLGRNDIEQVLRAVRQARRLNPSPSETIKVGYLSSKKDWDETSVDDYIKLYRDAGLDSPLKSKWRWWLEAEPQFTIRLLPHITGNHLLFIDKPRRDRPPIIDGSLFDDSSLPTAKRSQLDARKLSKLMMQSHLLGAESKKALAGYLDAIDREEARFRCLTVALAVQAYFRDNGEFPADAKQLVPEYLKEIPDDLYSPTPAPLVYRRDGDGAVVYSRFDNQVDDGGFEIDYDENAGSGDLTDFGFRIRNPFDQPLAAPK